MYQGAPEGGQHEDGPPILPTHCSRARSAKRHWFQGPSSSTAAAAASQRARPQAMQTASTESLLLRVTGLARGGLSRPEQPITSFLKRRVKKAIFARARARLPEGALTAPAVFSSGCRLLAKRVGQRRVRRTLQPVHSAPPRAPFAAGHRARSRH
jgi:hypothetical protein